MINTAILQIILLLCEFQTVYFKVESCVKRLFKLIFNKVGESVINFRDAYCNENVICRDAVSRACLSQLIKHLIAISLIFLYGNIIETQTNG